MVRFPKDKWFDSQRTSGLIPRGLSSQRIKGPIPRGLSSQRISGPIPRVLGFQRTGGPIPRGLSYKRLEFPVSQIIKCPFPRRIKCPVSQIRENKRYFGDEVPTVQCALCYSALHRIFSMGRNFMFGKILR